MKKYSGGRRRSFLGYRRRQFKGSSRARPVASKRNFYISPTRPIYSPLPAQFRCALNLCTSFEREIAGGVAGRTAWEAVSCFAPLLNSTLEYPEGFPSLMRLYSRAFVDFVQVKLTYQSFFEEEQTLVNNPAYAIDILGVIIPVVDRPADDTAAAAYFDRFASLPESQVKSLGPPTGGHDIQVLYFSIDTKKYLQASSSQEALACTSDLAPTLSITTPSTSITAHPAQPILYLSQRNNTKMPKDANFRVRMELTYHITFSAKHRAGMTILTG